jgi:Mg2+-importing ATPase
LDEAILAMEKPDLNNVIKLDEVPYDFHRKRLSVLVQQNGEKLLITKGALDNVLSVCSRYQQNQSIEMIDKDTLSQINQRLIEWSEQGYRVLGVSTKIIDDNKQGISRADETDMLFTGYLLFFDPPKAEAKEAILSLTRLGVQLKIITGDNKLVAEHTAEQVGLDKTLILTGSQIDELGDEAFWNVAERTTIFADVDPNQKERIILALKKTGHVVGYMGDGINDAPSMHSADIGISVENAVDVAKEAADFVLLKQDLRVLEQGIIQGRKTFANTMKYIYMATSANFGNMFSMAIASIFLPFLPMLPKQILLINFLTDLPEFTIAEDNVDKEYLENPQPWDIHSIRRFMLVFGPLSSIFDLATFAVLLLILKANQNQFHTAWFVESVISACLVVFVLRTRLPFLRSKPSRWMLLVSLSVILATLIIPFTFLATPFGFTPLPINFILAIGMLVLVYLTASEFVKNWFFKRYTALSSG